MEKYGLSILSVFLIFLLSACTHNEVYINREQDNFDGKIFLNKFYSNIARKDGNGIDSMVGDSLKQLAGTNGISKMVEFINGKVGNYKSYIVDDHYIRYVTGRINETSYNYKLKVTYDKGIIDEIIGFRKENGSEIKINSYHVNSDLLMH